jgi:two-component system KDP operon response regulator KdpE
MTRVLVVDDDPALQRALAIALRARDYSVTLAANGEAALRSAAAEPPDVVVLDLGLPDLDGVAVINGLRRFSAVPIIVLSGRAESSDKVSALDAGADDYVTKPFGMAELLARLRATVRRFGGEAGETEIRFGDVSVDLVAHRVRKSGPNGATDVRLTPTEWHVLELLLRNPGRLVGRRRLLTEVWGPAYASEVGYARLYLAQLRKKLEPDPGRPRYLITEPGMGYRFQPDADGESDADGRE